MKIPKRMLLISDLFNIIDEKYHIHRKKDQSSVCDNYIIKENEIFLLDKYVSLAEIVKEAYERQYVYYKSEGESGIYICGYCMKVLYGIDYDQLLNGKYFF